MLHIIEGQVELIGSGTAVGTPLYASITNFPAGFNIGNGGLGTNANPLVVTGTTFTPPADQGVHLASGAGFAVGTPLFAQITNFPATQNVAITVGGTAVSAAAPLPVVLSGSPVTASAGIGVGGSGGIGWLSQIDLNLSSHLGAVGTVGTLLYTTDQSRQSLAAIATNVGVGAGTDTVVGLLRKTLDLEKPLVASNAYPFETGWFNQTPPFANQWHRIKTLVVPAGLYAVPVSFNFISSTGNASGRIAEQSVLGAFTVSPNTYTPGSTGNAATYDGWGDLDLECLTTFLGGAAAATFTITFTDDTGASHTSTVTVAARMAVGQRINIPLASPSNFATAITNLTCSVANFTAGKVQVTASKTLVASSSLVAGTGVEVEGNRRKVGKPSRSLVFEYNPNAVTNGDWQFTCPIELTADI